MKRISIIIPTWKNVALIDLIYRALKRNSAVNHEIIVFFNECGEAERQWRSGKDITSDSSETNLGVCAAFNRAAKLATGDYICYMNDDMYPLPGWDVALEPYMGMADKLWLSSTPIEPHKANPCAIGCRDYGDSPANFRETDLLRDFEKLKRPYNMVSTWTPFVIPRANWEAIGGFDEAYFPGSGSDPDLAMKMFQHGCRLFIGAGSSLVYHFARQSISRYDKQGSMDPRRYFKQKWGMSWRQFLNSVLYRGEVITPRILEKIRRKGATGRFAPDA